MCFWDVGSNILHLSIACSARSAGDVTHRRQTVCIKGKQSNWEEVWSGVSQGSVLGPLLFLIFIKVLEDNTAGNMLKFADDTKIFRQVKDRHDNVCMQAD